MRTNETTDEDFGSFQERTTRHRDRRVGVNRGRAGETSAVRSAASGSSDTCDSHQALAESARTAGRAVTLNPHLNRGFVRSQQKADRAWHRRCWVAVAI